MRFVEGVGQDEESVAFHLLSFLVWFCRCDDNTEGERWSIYFQEESCVLDKGDWIPDRLSGDEGVR